MSGSHTPPATPVRSYRQNCPIALGLDVLGERWTLLVLRELLGGPRRYGDLRQELPGISSNLLAERLRELGYAGLIDRTDVPAPVARTMYTLSDTGWRTVPPVLRALALFGVASLDHDTSAATALNGFLAGILLAFDPHASPGLDACYRVDVDDRRFDFVVRGAALGAATTAPDVTVTAGAVDLLDARMAVPAAERRAALNRIDVRGSQRDTSAFRAAFHLDGDLRIPTDIN